MAQIDVTNLLIDRLAPYGSYGLTLIILGIIIYYLAKKVKELEDKLEEITSKSIEALTLANQTIENSRRSQEEQARELRDLTNTVANSKSCNYNER